MKYTICHENSESFQKEEENEKTPMNRPNILANLKKVKNKILEKKLCVVLIFISFF